MLIPYSGTEPIFHANFHNICKWHPFILNSHDQESYLMCLQGEFMLMPQQMVSFNVLSRIVKTFYFMTENSLRKWLGPFFFCSECHKHKAGGNVYLQPWDPSPYCERMQCGRCNWWSGTLYVILQQFNPRLSFIFSCISSGKPSSFFPEDSFVDTGEIDVGRRATQKIPPGIFWRSQVFIDHSVHLKFNVSLGKSALVGIYGRKGLPPSHTQVRRML